MSYIPTLKAFIEQANSSTHENSSTRKPPTLKPTKNLLRQICQILNPPNFPAVRYVDI